MGFTGMNLKKLKGFRVSDTSDERLLRYGEGGNYVLYCGRREDVIDAIGREEFEYMLEKHGS